MFKLSLKRQGRNEELLLNLSEKTHTLDKKDIEKVIYNRVFSDRVYSVKLFCDYNDINNVEFYINGFLVKGSFFEGEFSFEDPRIFLDNFGFAQISLVLIYDETVVTLFSDYLNVMIKEGVYSETIKKMALYVYNNQEKLLLNNNMKSLDYSDLKESDTLSIESQLYIIRQIMYEYKSAYRYFRNNSKFILNSDTTVDSYDKLTNVNRSTINYIVQHPEELSKTNIATGININNQNFLPRKTLIVEKKKDYNVYENRIVLGFLLTVLRSIDILIKTTVSMIDMISSMDDFSQEYYSSAKFIYGITYKKLDDFVNDLSIYKEEFNNLYRLYSNVLKIDSTILTNIPHTTHIFNTVKEYNRLYKLIIKWFKHGIYNLNKETFLTSFLSNNQLFECYVLLKFYDCFTSNDFVLNKVEKYTYRPQNAKYYQNTKHNNTFEFIREETRITLYYQPVVYLKPNVLSNGINLLRNNSLSIGINREFGGSYYLPDYIVKIAKDGKDIYLIADAKFSTSRVIRQRYFPELAYKYLFSISPINEDSKLLGLCVIAGKPSGENKPIASIYTDYTKDIIPFADIISIMDQEDEQIHTLTELLSKCIPEKNNN